MSHACDKLVIGMLRLIFYSPAGRQSSLLDLDWSREEMEQVSYVCDSPALLDLDGVVCVTGLV